MKIERLGRVEAGTKTVTPSRIKAILVALVLFLAWCVAVIVLDSLLLRRARSRLGQGPGAAELDPRAEYASPLGGSRP